MLCVDFGDDYIKIKYFDMVEGEKKLNSIKKRLDKFILAVRELQEQINDKDNNAGGRTFTLFSFS